MLGGEFCDRALKLRPAFQVCREGPEFARDRSQCLDCRLFLLNDLLLCRSTTALSSSSRSFALNSCSRLLKWVPSFCRAERADPVRPGLCYRHPVGLDLLSLFFVLLLLCQKGAGPLYEFCKPELTAGFEPVVRKFQASAKALPDRAASGRTPLLLVQDWQSLFFPFQSVLLSPRPVFCRTRVHR